MGAGRREDLRTSITVAIPTYGRSASLLRALRSLAEQSFPLARFEVLVVDDGSMDDTRAVFSSWAKTAVGVRARLVSQPNRGLNAARNTALAEAESDVVVMLDDDEEAPEGWLKHMVDALDRNPDAGCVGGPYFRRSPVPSPRTCANCSLDDGTVDLGPPERLVSGVPGGNMAIRLWVVDQTGGFDEQFSGGGDETEWLMRLTDAGVPIVFAPDAWVWHHRSREQSTLRAIVVKLFRRGRESSFVETAVGRPMSAGRELSRIPRLLAHSIRSRCWWGVVTSAWILGRVLGRRRPHRVSGQR